MRDRSIIVPHMSAYDLSQRLRTAAFLSTVIVVLSTGCDHLRSTPQGARPSNEVSHSLIGKQITVRGRFSLAGVVGPYILLGNQQPVYLVSRGSFTWRKPYSEMDGKLVEATGTLKFFHAPDAEPADQSMARPPDFFYFEAETVQLRLISH